MIPQLARQLPLPLKCLLMLSRHTCSSLSSPTRNKTLSSTGALPPYFPTPLTFRCRPISSGCSQSPWENGLHSSPFSLPSLLPTLKNGFLKAGSVPRSQIQLLRLYSLATVDHCLLAENFPSRWQYYFPLVFLLLLSPNIFSHPLRSLLFSTSIPDCCQNVSTLNAGVPQAPHFALFLPHILLEQSHVL